MKRRAFITRSAGAAAALTAGSGLSSATAQQPRPVASTNDRWLDGMTARHRCLFDFPQHGDGTPLIHMFNYIDTYRKAYGEPANTVNAIGTFYGAPGPLASIPLAWNDAIWDKYRIGDLLKLNDPATRAPTRHNMFYRPRAADPILFNGAMAIAGIENLQRMGATFLMCNNAFMAWIGFLSGAGTRGNPAEIERDLRANLVPGVVTVPALVIAIEKAQAKGIAYNRQ